MKWNLKCRREPEISLPLLKEFGSDLVNLYSLTIYCLARKFEVLVSKRIVHGSVPRDTLFHGTDIRNLPLVWPFFRNSKGQSNGKLFSSIGLTSKSFILLTITICKKTLALDWAESYVLNWPQLNPFTIFTIWRGLTAW